MLFNVVFGLRQVDVLRAQQEVAGLHQQMEKDARARALHQAKLQLEAEAEQARARGISTRHS